jgi:hypothetical protein
VADQRQDFCRLKRLVCIVRHLNPSARGTVPQPARKQKNKKTCPENAPNCGLTPSKANSAFSLNPSCARMKPEIRSYVGVGPIMFGMKAEEVRSTLVCAYREFKRVPFAKTTTDAFQPLGIYVYYTIDRKCNAIEMARPAQPFYADHELIGGSFDKMFDLIRGFDPEVKTDESGLTSFALGIGLYAPGCGKDRLLPVESVIAFQRGYYDAKKK